MAPHASRLSGGLARGSRLRTLGLPLAFGLFGLVVAIAALSVSVQANVPRPAIVGDQLVGLSYVITGTIAWVRRPRNLVGPAMLAAGITWYIADFTLVPIPAVTALSFAFVWLVNVFSAFLLLAYPTGRLFSRSAAVVFAVAITNSVVQYAARLFLVEGGAGRSTATGSGLIGYGCECPNPFVLMPNDALFGAVMAVTRVVAVVVAVAILVLIIRRFLRATPAGRRQLAPVMFGGAVAVAVFATDIAAYMTASGESAVSTASSVGLVFARAAVPIGFLLGLIRIQIDRTLVAKLVVKLGEAPTPEGLETVLAATLHDPTLRVAYWSPATRTYLDARGRRVDLSTDPGRSVHVVERDGGPLCAIEHDVALYDDPDLLAAVAAAVKLAVDRDRLESMVHAQVTESQDLPAGPVTLLYSDIEGSSALLDTLGTEYADVLAEQRRVLRAIVREAGGVEVDSRADEFFAAFPRGSSPARAAVEIQRRLRDRDWPGGVDVHVRLGLHHGEPELGDEGYVGMDVHLVARLASAGHGGQILVSGAARDVVEADLPSGASLIDLGSHALRGIPGRHQILQLAWPDHLVDFPPLRVGFATPSNAQPPAPGSID